MLEHAFALFDTAIGRCGIAWGPSGICALHLPERRDDITRARLLRACSGAREAQPPPEIQRVVDAIVALLRGEAVDLTGAHLDMSRVPELNRRVYDVARTIPPGRTLTYGQVAERLGEPGLARAVGQALGQNPFPIVVPCHRVIAAGNSLGGFSAHGGRATKLRLLTIEGGRPTGTLPLFGDDDPGRLDDR